MWWAMPALLYDNNTVEDAALINAVPLTAQSKYIIKHLVIYSTVKLVLDAYSIDDLFDAVDKKCLNNQLLAHRAVFVSMFCNNQLRGCIGETDAYEPLWQNIIRFCMHSTRSDPRFDALEADELANTHFTVSVLSDLKQVVAINQQTLLTQLQVGIDGLVLDDGKKRAVFLPCVWSHFKHEQDFITELLKKGEWQATKWPQHLTGERFTVETVTGSILS